MVDRHQFGDPGLAAGRSHSRGGRTQKNEEEPDPAEFPFLSQRQDRSGNAQGHKTRQRRHAGSLGKVGAPAARLHDIDQQAIPHRGRGMSEGKVQHGAADQEPGTMLGQEQREREDRQPAEGLGPAAADQELRRHAEILEQFHGQELCHHTDQLGQRGQDADVEWRGMQKQGKGREIVFPATLRGRLKGRIADTIPAALSLGILIGRMRKIA